MAASYSPALHRSTIGATGLNFSVRNGKRWNPGAIAALNFLRNRSNFERVKQNCAATRPKTTPYGVESLGQLVALGCDVTVYTPAPYQRPRLGRPLWGALISRPASRLDAFSAYPIQTQIPGGAPGGTTGKPEVCPPRSSRTSGGTTQNSCAHDR